MSLLYHKHKQKQILAENIDYDFILKLLGIIGASIGVLKYLDYHYKSRLQKDTTQAINTNDIDGLEEQLRMISKELTNTKDEIFTKFHQHEEFSDQSYREIRADVVKLIHDLASLEGAFKTYKEMDSRK